MVKQFFQMKIPVFLLLRMLFPGGRRVFVKLNDLVSTGSQVQRYVCENVARVMAERRKTPAVRVICSY
jgi:hypothetical protein